MLDANQTFHECYSSNDVRPYTTEWLKLSRGMIDPFIQTSGYRPYSTTQIPIRDIDYVLTFNVPVTTISTLPLNTPAQSDHLGILFDVDISSFFSANYSDVATYPKRMLTSGNKKAVESYVSTFLEQYKHHNKISRTNRLLDIALNNPKTFDKEHIHALNSLDEQITEILLAAERGC